MSDLSKSQDNPSQSATSSLQTSILRASAQQRPLTESQHSALLSSGSVPPGNALR
ncbi:unnamed protein product [Anisakis simplex]|uniref:Uncharacterized protein n=1 Tax=Anisakis simplex TaxID=6269 RepID=A0A0M3KAH0_ANISI|nr:unnamed protein product [Anisakis simplex]